MILKIGLTGGMGSGKTTVAKIFELLGVPVYYADAAAKQLYYTNKDLMAEVKKHFGDDVYTERQLNRSNLASKVFNDPEKLGLLNSIVHPATIRDAEEWIANQTYPYIIKEAALLFESGSASGLNHIIGVRSPQHLRLKRVMDRDGFSREEILSRMKQQIDEEIKMRLCDYIIENNEETLVIPQVLQLHQTFLKMAGN
jgi:dephospho-CoA kinase